MAEVRPLQQPVKEVPTPAPDGMTTLFFTSRSYQYDTLSVWVNGLRKVAEWDDGFLEVTSAGVGNSFLMKEPPLEGDSLQVQYEPA